MRSKKVYTPEHYNKKNQKPNDTQGKKIHSTHFTKSFHPSYLKNSSTLLGKSPTLNGGKGKMMPQFTEKEKMPNIMLHKSATNDDWSERLFF